MTRAFVSTLALILAVATAASAQSHSPVFPITKGTTWTYSARVKWDRTGAQPAGVRTLTWTSAVVDSFENGDVSAALLHGGPWDLAWYYPQQTKPDDYLVIHAGDAYYLVQDDARANFARLKKATAADIAENYADDLWFRVPLQIGDNYCAPSQEQTAPFYCWSVEKVTNTHSLRVAGFSPKSTTEYFLAFLTNPDTTTLTLVPGAGIVSYYYQHHGTIAEASVKLVRFRPGSPVSSRVSSRKPSIQTRKVK